MPTFIKVILKLFATNCLLKGILFEVKYPDKSSGGILLAVVFGWLIWKLWKKKTTLIQVAEKPACAHCGVIKA